MINFRETIKARMAELGVPSGYALAKIINHRITVATIDRYLKGKSEMTSANLEIILCALGAENIQFQKTRGDS